MTEQMDILRDDPKAAAQRWRTCAEMARIDPHYFGKDRDRRVEYYEREAARLERMAEVA